MNAWGYLGVFVNTFQLFVELENLRESIRKLEEKLESFENTTGTKEWWMEG